MASAILGDPEAGRLAAITEHCWSQQAPDSTGEPPAMNKGENPNSFEPIEETLKRAVMSQHKVHLCR